MDFRKIIKIIIIFSLLTLLTSCRMGDKNEFATYLSDVSDSTVFIGCDDFKNIGVGVVISEDGYIVTAKHVVSKCKAKIEVYFLDDFGTPIHTYLAEDVNKSNLEFDVALLKIEPRPFHKLDYVEISDRSDVKIGDTVGFTGFPYAPLLQQQDIKNPFVLLACRGIISGRYTDPGLLETNFYTINTFSNPGDSGGPVFLEKNGKLIGVVKGPILPVVELEVGRVGQTLVNPLHGVLDELED